MKSDWWVWEAFSVKLILLEEVEWMRRRGKKEMIKNTKTLSALHCLVPSKAVLAFLLVYLPVSWVTEPLPNLKTLDNKASCEAGKWLFLSVWVVPSSEHDGTMWCGSAGLITSTEKETRASRWAQIDRRPQVWSFQDWKLHLKSMKASSQEAPWFFFFFGLRTSVCFKWDDLKNKVSK